MRRPQAGGLTNHHDSCLGPLLSTCMRIKLIAQAKCRQCASASGSELFEPDHETNAAPPSAPRLDFVHIDAQFLLEMLEDASRCDVQELCPRSHGVVWTASDNIYYCCWVRCLFCWELKSVGSCLVFLSTHLIDMRTGRGQSLPYKSDFSQCRVSFPQACPVARMKLL